MTANAVALVLIVAGIIWFFLVGRPWAQPPGKGVATTAPTNPVIELIRWLVGLAQKLPSAFLPGVFLIAAGLVVFALGATKGDSNSNTTTTTTSTAVSVHSSSSTP